MKVPLKMLLAVGFSRWRIERLFEDSKQEVGLDHPGSSPGQAFEVRSYPGLMRHLILTMLSLYFLVEHYFQQEQETSCVPACARMVLVGLGIDAPEMDLRTLLQQFEQGTGIWDLDQLPQ